MIRSLRTGITGLRTNQLRLDVIGNNIAGVNTTGFKRSRILFQDTLAQRIATGGRLSGPNAPNISSIGNGVSVGAIDQVWSQGALDYTNLPTDLALAGDGFFIAESSQGNVLTRQGAFTFDADGFLVTPDALRIQGWPAGVDGTIATGALQDIRINPSTTAPPVRTSGMVITGNLAAERAVGTDDPITMSSVIYDGTGRAHTIVLTAAKTADDTWAVTSAEIAGDPNAIPPIPATALNVSGDDLVFDSDGKLDTGAIFTVDGAFPRWQHARHRRGPLVHHPVRWIHNHLGRQSERLASGRPCGLRVRPDRPARAGVLERRAPSGGPARPRRGLQPRRPRPARRRLLYDDGCVGRSPDRPRGKRGLGRRHLRRLESSNVDLAEEFTDMIVAQRGYQANARVITTSDELLQETVQLKR